MVMLVFVITYDAVELFGRVGFVGLKMLPVRIGDNQQSFYPSKSFYCICSMIISILCTTEKETIFKKKSPLLRHINNYPLPRHTSLAQHLQRLINTP